MPEAVAAEFATPIEVDSSESGETLLSGVRIGPTAVSITVHLAIVLILMLFTYGIEKRPGLSLFLKLGDSDAAGGSLQPADANLIEPLDMPAVDVTRLEALEPEPALNPNLPRMTIAEIMPERISVERPSLDSDGFGTSQFDGLSETVRGVSVKIGDPQLTLIWDTDADLDLHVIEPGGAHIFWEHRNGTRGGELDVDDTDGLGPENVFWKKGAGPDGKYLWWVHYLGGNGGRIRKTEWKVRIKHDGRLESFTGKFTQIDEKSPERAFVKGEVTTR